MIVDIVVNREEGEKGKKQKEKEKENFYVVRLAIGFLSCVAASCRLLNVDDARHKQLVQPSAVAVAPARFRSQRRIPLGSRRLPSGQCSWRRWECCSGGMNLTLDYFMGVDIKVGFGFLCTVLAIEACVIASAPTLQQLQVGLRAAGHCHIATLWTLSTRVAIATTWASTSDLCSSRYRELE